MPTYIATYFLLLKVLSFLVFFLFLYSFLSIFFLIFSVLVFFLSSSFLYSFSIPLFRFFFNLFFSSTTSDFRFLHKSLLTVPVPFYLKRKLLSVTLGSAFCMYCRFMVFQLFIFGEYKLLRCRFISAIHTIFGKSPF